MLQWYDFDAFQFIPPRSVPAAPLAVILMEMHQVRYFLAVAETLNFTRAAERCNVSQPALTRAIQNLEGEFGGLLFRRERNLTHLTELGRLVRPRLEEILNQADTAKRAASAFLKLDDAPLSLGVMCTIGPLHFVGFLNQFRAKNRGVQVSLIEAVPERLSQLMLDGRIDVALMAQPTAFHERLRSQELYHERFVVAFPAGHSFQSKNAVELADMDGQNYLDRINCEYGDHIGGLCSQRGVRLNIEYRSEREDWIQMLIAAGIGVCFMPEFSATTPGVFTRPVINPEIVRRVSLVTVAGRRFSPAVAAFTQAVRSYRWARAEAA